MIKGKDKEIKRGISKQQKESVKSFIWEKNDAFQKNKARPFERHNCAWRWNDKTTMRQSNISTTFNDQVYIYSH